MLIAVAIGIVIIGIVIFVNYYFDQAQLSGQRFGDQLSQIQTDLKNETLDFDKQFTLYKSGQISKDQMITITNSHLQILQNIYSRYDELNPPESFGPSLQLFRLSTQSQIESDNYLKDWLQTGNNESKTKSDQLLQESFQYEMNGLQSYGNLKSKGSQ